MSQRFQDRRFERSPDGTWRAVQPAGLLVGHVDAKPAIDAHYRKVRPLRRHYAFCALMAALVTGSIVAIVGGRLDIALALFMLMELGALSGLLWLDGAP